MCPALSSASMTIVLAPFVSCKRLTEGTVQERYHCCSVDADPLQTRDGIHDTAGDRQPGCRDGGGKRRFNGQHRAHGVQIDDQLHDWSVLPEASAALIFDVIATFGERHGIGDDTGPDGVDDDHAVHLDRPLHRPTVVFQRELEWRTESCSRRRSERVHRTSRSHRARRRSWAGVMTGDVMSMFHGDARNALSALVLWSQGRPTPRRYR